MGEMSLSVYMKGEYKVFCGFMWRKNKANSKPNKANFKQIYGLLGLLEERLPPRNDVPRRVFSKGCREVVAKTMIWDKSWIPAFAGMTVFCVNDSLAQEFIPIGISPCLLGQQAQLHLRYRKMSQ